MLGELDRVRAVEPVFMGNGDALWPGFDAAEEGRDTLLTVIVDDVDVVVPGLRAKSFLKLDSRGPEVHEDGALALDALQHREIGCAAVAARKRKDLVLVDQFGGNDRRGVRFWCLPPAI